MATLLLRQDKIQKQKIDHHLSKRIPLRARSSNLSPFLTNLVQRYAVALGARFSQ